MYTNVQNKSKLSSAMFLNHALMTLNWELAIALDLFTTCNSVEQTIYLTERYSVDHDFTVYGCMYMHGRRIITVRL
jgi:hypothetical protein